MKVTYIFGAGASSGTIPLAKELGSDIGATAIKINSDLISFYSKGQSLCPPDRLPPPNGTNGNLLFQSMDWLYKVAKNHNSIDTIARKLWMRSDSSSLQELSKLKATLTAYLWYKQISQPSDRRYDTFLATILQKKGGNKPILPIPINILTWNYDLLIERSFYEYRIDYKYIKEYIFKNNLVVHLNGYASVEPQTQIQFMPSDFEKFEYALFVDIDDRFEGIIELFNRCINSPLPQRLITKIAFAWENINNINLASDIAKDTTILIIVGYSFPFFNRDADLKILKEAVPTLERIYLQVNQSIGPHEKVLSILSQINPTKNWENIIMDINDPDYIYIPNELIQ
jgi:hypothetical protein